jgi:regulation of enolase protein 1 (concanavalin A-like superfamily)
VKDFQQNLNNSGQIELTTDGAVISASAETDWFFHPNGQVRLSNVPSLFIETDAQVISLRALVTVEFAGSYDAGALFVQTAEDHWAKLAYEFSPQAIPTVVSVVTKGVSDDCDGPRVPAGQVWLRVYVDGNIVNFHFSEDGTFWRFNRTFALPRSLDGKIKLGLSAQAPLGNGSRATFRNVTVNHDAISNFRNGQ